MLRTSTLILSAATLSVGFGIAPQVKAQATPPHGHGNPAAQLDAAERAQAKAGIFASSQITRRFAPVSNALSLPGAPASAEATPQGLAGGDEALLKGWTVWGSLVGRATENNFAPEEEDSDIWTVSLGMDRPVSETVTLGVSITATTEDATTAFGTGSRDAGSVFIAPYANFKLNDWLSADISFGYGFTDTDQRRTVGGAPVTGSYDSDTLFGAANLTASKWNGAWLMSGVVGLSASSTDRETFVESDGTVNPSDTSDLVQGRIGGTIGYWAKPMLPYVSAEYAYDFNHDSSTVAGAPNDRDEFCVTLGSDIYATGDNENLSGGFSITHAFGRDSKEDTSANFSLRIAF